MPGVSELVTLIQCLQIPSKTQYMFKQLKQIHQLSQGNLSLIRLTLPVRSSIPSQPTKTIYL